MLLNILQCIRRPTSEPASLHYTIHLVTHSTDIRKTDSEFGTTWVEHQPAQ